MPLIPYVKNIIEIPVADRIFNDTKIKQKARFIKLNHIQNPRTNESSATVLLEITMYSADGENFGAALSGAGFTPYSVELTADNNTIVDTADGSILFVRTTESNEAWQSLADLSEKNTMYQGDFFELIRDSQPVEIGDMIKHHILQANQMGKFA